VSALATMAAALLIGLFLGFVLTATYVASTRSHFQERMQRKVLYWQAETARARETTEQLIRRLEARDTGPEPPTGRDWQ
jgi:hypothetical protein